MHLVCTQFVVEITLSVKTMACFTDENNQACPVLVGHEKSSGYYLQYSGGVTKSLHYSPHHHVYIRRARQSTVWSQLQ